MSKAITVKLDGVNVLTLAALLEDQALNDDRAVIRAELDNRFGGVSIVKVEEEISDLHLLIITVADFLADAEQSLLEREGVYDDDESDPDVAAYHRELLALIEEFGSLTSALPKLIERLRLLKMLFPYALTFMEKVANSMGALGAETVSEYFERRREAEERLRNDLDNLGK